MSSSQILAADTSTVRICLSPILVNIALLQSHITTVCAPTKAVSDGAVTKENSTIFSRKALANSGEVLAFTGCRVNSF